MIDVAQMLELGKQHQRAGNLAEAEWLYQQVLLAEPHHPDALRQLATLCLASGRFVEAASALGRVLQLEPPTAAVHNDLGIALAQQGLADDAFAHFQRAIELQPSYALAHQNLGLLLLRRGQHDLAEASARRAAELQPDLPQAHNGLGEVLRDRGELAEAIDCYRRALELRPDFAEACNNLGIVLAQSGRAEEAIDSFRRAIQLRPQYAKAHHNLGITLLRYGDFEQGWQEYEWRLLCAPEPPARLDQPRWGGEPLQGRTILLHAEQGLGDTIQFIRYALLVQQRGGRVLVVCSGGLTRLLAGCPGVDGLLNAGPPLPLFDVHAPLLSLPGIFGTNLASIPAVVPYLSAEPDLVQKWAAEVRARPGLKVGIAWQGNPKNPDSRWRSVPLALFAPLAQVPGVQLFSLQKGPGSEQLSAVADSWPITDLASRLDEESGPFLDTAAVMTHLDLVITVDTATAHLAGALGVRTWVALAFVADWRWLQEREDSPWYPTVRLFRQRQPGNWAEVFERMAAAFGSLA
jgi:Flp pilus assembly protein TadD